MNRREFSKLTTIAAFSFPFKNNPGRMGFFDFLRSGDDIKSHSIAAFKRFEAVWNFNDFWKRGNTFDACLTFADAMLHKWPHDSEVISMQKSIGEMLEENYKYFMSFDVGKLWANDFGWVE